MNDDTSHPDHYKTENYECYKVMQEVYGPVAFRAFCLLNAFKYLWRQGKKGPASEDVQKAKRYMELAPDTWDVRELIQMLEKNITHSTAVDQQLLILHQEKDSAETRIKQLTEQVVELKRSLRKKTRKGKTNG